MEGRTVFLGLALSLCVGTCIAQMSSTTKQQIHTGLSEFQDAVDGIEKLASNKKLISAIQKLSGFLGVAGGLVSFVLVFLPTQESAELKFMKKKFAEVNMKLDRITTEFDSVKDLITLENQRAIYISDSANIEHAYKQLTENYLTQMEAVKCSTTKDCLRERMKISESFKKTFDVKASVAKILTGTTTSTSVFGDPLLDLIQETYKCDVSKLDIFANGVLKNAFRGQQVVLAHEKLTGSKTSITLAMKEWSDMVYALRSKLDSVKKNCYDNIKKYMTADIEHTKYQTNMASNEMAANSMANSLKKKYPWVHWTVISYGAWGAHAHAGESIFINMPKGKNERKRVVGATPQDRATYGKQRVQFSQAIDKIVAKHKFINDAHLIHDKFALELKKMNIWKTLSSFIILYEYDNFKTSVDSSRVADWYNEEMLLTALITPQSTEPITKEFIIRIIATLYSSEEIEGVSCSRTCSKQGTCAVLPFSSSSYCICKRYYQGENCEEYDEIDLASSVDSMLEVTHAIPMLTDVYYELFDMQDYIGSSLNNVQNSIAALDMKLETKFNDLSNKITKEFQWAKLAIHYSETLRDLKFYLHRFQQLNTSNPLYTKDSGAVAKAVTQPGKIRKWLFELDKLIVGRNEISVLVHKPLLFLMMDTQKVEACDTQYKAALDNAWRQTVVLQNMAYIMWAQAKYILNEPTDEVLRLYHTRINAQTTFMETETCQLTVPNSINLNCSGGFYLYPETTVVNKCEQNYFIAGSTTTNCTSRSSSCEACRCNAQGSTGSECHDLTGQCNCTNGYYGKNCSNRDCKWTSFGSYGQCSKSCDYGGSEQSIRRHHVTQQGSGKSCTGSSSQTRSCFHECCSTQFHCSGSKKCIPKHQRCDYDKNCLSNEDEVSCSETCETRYTGWNTYGNERAHYLDRQRVNCGGYKKSVLKMFRLQRSGNNIRYQFICCNLLVFVGTHKLIHNSYTEDGGGDTVYLDKQVISCGEDGILNDFWLSRSSSGNEWRYNYYCLTLRVKYLLKKTCYESHTSYTYDGEGRNYYLDRQEVSCNHGYYLSAFRLRRDNAGNHWRYMYTCCHIKTT